MADRRSVHLLGFESTALFTIRCKFTCFHLFKHEVFVFVSNFSNSPVSFNKITCEKVHNAGTRNRNPVGIFLLTRETDTTDINDNKRTHRSVVSTVIIMLSNHNHT